jgi:asparagine synthase (glutamine-hydrolysing)
MCGICGLYSPSGAPQRSLVDDMRARIAHRGPDEGSADAWEQCVLGHQRLRVIDPEQGFQPVANEAGDVVAVFNGELYNFHDLRDDLRARGHEIRGRGDTPVIPHLYEEHGVDFVERLEGMFAVALYDRARRRLVLARDRLGKKPLVWTRLSDGTFAFASELKAFAALPGFAAEPDLAALDAYLALGYVPGGRTGLRGLHRLAPASLLVVEGESQTERVYWHPEVGDETLADDEWLERVRDEVSRAVRRRLVADVPLGALLSGGIDSAVVVAQMAQTAAEPVRTFTVGFSDDAYDERRYARAVAERWSTRHEEIVLEPDAAATLPRLAAAFDEPLGDEAALPLLLVCEATRSHVTVALVGDGGDEVFGGYERYRAHELAAKVPAPLARVALTGGWGRREPRSTLFRARRFLDVAATPKHERYARLVEVFPLELRRRLWTEEALAQTTASLLPQGDDLRLVDLESYLPGDLLPKSDLTSMAVSLELRSPFLDHRVVELGLALPRELASGKRALREAFADDLPPEVASRRKTGFGVPLGRWFREELRPLAEDLLLGGDDRGLFRRPELERLLREHADRRADHGHRLWCLVMLELWQRNHVDAARPALAAA